MKRNIFVVLLVALLVFAWSAGSYAQEKIAFINMREIIQASNEGKKAGDEMKRIADRKQAEITAMERELKVMKDDLDKKGSVMTAKARSDQESAYQKKLRSYQILVNDANEELQKKDQEVFQKLMPDIMKIIRAIGEKEKYTLIVDVATMPVPYFDKSKDISKKVVDEFNKR